MTMTHLLQWRRMRQERIAALLYYFGLYYVVLAPQFRPS
ncbi:protein of unknown function (plasmid) [Methylocella tundrae]|uniref:Uncharacterized protein n=1 Tax=Methylocella tundrae TaxID=227605 RepID=A0A4U8Z6G6_METTU|nr:protein of unknown function [Methylocella tundrae]